MGLSHPGKRGRYAAASLRLQERRIHNVLAIDELETTFIDLAVLPNDDIVLTSSYLVQVRNRKGDIVKESSESLYPYGEIKSIAYSHAQQDTCNHRLRKIGL